MASYQVLQAKFPAVLGSRAPIVKRVDGNDGVLYRAMVGPFSTADEAFDLCESLKAAGGECIVQRN
nr:SPOR domain-containing protein [Bradyrhizobium sp. AUGA SZCCT0169]